MQITVNGEIREVEDGATAADLLDQLGLGDQRVAMEVNLEIVPRSEYPAHRLAPGDRVEIVRAIGGG
jgi:sulfur carrier protein